MKNHMPINPAQFCALFVLSSLFLTSPALAEGEANAQPQPAEGGAQTESAPAPTLNANTGIARDTVIGNNSMHAENTGVAVNGQVQDSNINNNQNDNTLSNLNVLRPVVMSPSQGGNSALVLPRNPLPMPNAMLGRSNFGMQVGVQNNPGIPSASGKGNALGWFMQAGVTIPFGKIPEAFTNPHSAQLDDMRRQKQAANRDVFGNMNPNNGIPQQVETKVRGKVVGLSAFNYTSLPSEKVGLEAPSMPNLDIQQPKVLALAPAEVFNRPLNTGDKVGLIEVGREYPYLGHTRSGWVKVLLPNGSEGWASTQFEYIKYDFTEIDTLAVDPSAGKMNRAAEKPKREKAGNVAANASKASSKTN